MPMIMAGMDQHAPGRSTERRTVASALEYAIPVEISMLCLDRLMLSRLAPAACLGQQEKWPRSDVGQGSSEPESSGTTHDLDTQIACAQAPQVGQQQRRGLRDRPGWGRSRLRGLHGARRQPAG